MSARPGSDSAATYSGTSSSAAGPGVVVMRTRSRSTGVVAPSYGWQGDQCRRVAATGETARQDPDRAAADRPESHPSGVGVGEADAEGEAGSVGCPGHLRGLLDAGGNPRDADRARVGNIADLDETWCRSARLLGVKPVVGDGQTPPVG